MKFTLKYFFSFIFLFLSLGLFAQNTQDKKQEKKSDSVVPKTERYGIRVGIDVSKLAQSLYEKNYRGFEIVGDYRLTKRMFLAGEIGSENKNVIDNTLNFTTSGTYFKVGFDVNNYENWLDMENIIYVGLRYGVSSFSQKLNSYKIYNTSTYFPQTPEIISDTNYNGLSAQWTEVVAGVKVEVLNNIYIGFSGRLNYLFSNKKPENFDNLYIPGFNRTYDGKFGVGWNYTISYFIPLYKSKK